MAYREVVTEGHYCGWLWKRAWCFVELQEGPVAGFKRLELGRTPEEQEGLGQGAPYLVS